jgi:PAT family beta-lactamase induction signal transducer AmpG
MGSVFIEQFGYGFGFSMYMLYMLYIAGQGVNKASHYALCTGFMALSFMLPGMLSGILQEFLGYEYYFIMVTALASLSFVSIYIIPIDPEFGLKKKKA